MNPALAGVALAVTAGAVIAASAREVRAAMIGLALVLGLGPFMSDPLPGPAAMGARVVTGILVASLLRAVSVGDGDPGFGSRIGWPAETGLAAAAGIAGLSISAGLATLQPGRLETVPGTDLLDRLTPEAVALAAGLASITVGLAPAFFARGALRAAIGMLLLAQGVVLARTGVAGPPGELEQLGIDGLILAVGTLAAVIAIVERGDGRRDAPESAAQSAR